MYLYVLIKMYIITVFFFLTCLCLHITAKRFQKNENNNGINSVNNNKNNINTNNKCI
jgi:preprotein translocase subunit SecG